METMSIKDISFPPLFRGKCVPAQASTFMKAIVAAKNNVSPGLVFYSEDIGSLEASIVLAPDISLKRALEELEKLTQVLAQNFVEKYGAPNLDAAYPVAKEEVDFMKSICEEHPVNTLLMVSRELTDNGIREKFRHIKATDAELEAFAVHGSTE